ncbi:7406_t:CDS:2, partial [Ambispora gerdemannii]
SNKCRTEINPRKLREHFGVVEQEPRSATIRSGSRKKAEKRTICKSKEIASFCDSIVEREKQRAIKEHDYTLSNKFEKNISMGVADVARVQRENEAGIDSEERSYEKFVEDIDTDLEPRNTEHQIRPSKYSEEGSPEQQNTLPEDEIDTKDDNNTDVGKISNTSKRKQNENNDVIDDELLENTEFLFNKSNEESIIEKVDENSLFDEARLPSRNINDRTPEEFLNANIQYISKKKYQKLARS